MAPRALERAALEKNGASNARSILKAKSLNFGDEGCAHVSCLHNLIDKLCVFLRHVFTTHAAQTLTIRFLKFCTRHAKHRFFLVATRYCSFCMLGICLNVSCL